MTQLSDEMDVCATFLTTVPGPGVPVLYLFDNDNHVNVCLLLGADGGGEIARAARTLVLEQEPRVAILQIEAWTHKPGLPMTDPDFRRLAMGEITPSMLPEEKRGEGIILYGESADGETQHRMWIIETTDGERHLTEMPAPDKAFTRFQPLFVVEHTMRLVESGDLPDEVREAFAELGDITPEEKRFATRQAVGAMLASGGGATTREFEQASHQATVDMRDLILSSREPART